MHPISTFCAALSMYTRFLIPHKNYKDVSLSALLFNLIIVGVILGGFWWALYSGMILCNVPTVVLAGIMVILPLWFTDFVHFEGFMQTSIDISSSRRKCQQGGAKGIIALVIVVLLNFVGINNFIICNEMSYLLIFIPIISRELTVLSLFMLPTLSNEAKSARKSEYTVIIMVLFVITIVFCVTLTGIRGAVLVVSMLFSFLYAILRVKSTSGISGDSAGYLIVLTETVGILALAILRLR